MKALILIGGYGTRLRPLTLSVPKPLVEFCNKPMLVHQIQALLEIGVMEIVLAINREAVSLEGFIRELCDSVIKEKGVKVCFSYEDEPLGTGGPLSQAADLLQPDGEPFFVLNSDIICNYPFKKMLEFHNSHGHEGTLAVTKVEEPSKYGAVVHNDKTGLVKQFVEKPNEYIANRINAGLYIFNPSILKRLTCKPTSIELEVFPQMVADKELFCIEFSGFWMDVGQPADYLLGMRLYLGYLYESKSSQLSSNSSCVGNVLLHPTARIGEGCRIGPNVTIGEGVVLQAGVRIRNSAVLANAVIGSHSWIDGCIIGWRCTVGRWVRMENVTVLGEDVQVQDELFLNGALVLPHNSISKSVQEPQILM